MTPIHIGMARTARAPEPTGDEGYTLPEAIIAMTVFLVILAVIGSVTTAMTANMRQTNGVSLATDQVRLVMQRLDRQVRYADAMSTPGGSADSWYIEFSQKSEREHASGDVDDACQQWRYVAPYMHGGRLQPGTMQTRSWLVKNDGSLRPGSDTPWITVASGINNDIATEPPFLIAGPSGRLEAAPATDRVHQGLTVDLRARRGDRPGGDAQTKATFFARNTTNTPAIGVCEQLGRS